jgi:hypothetical protein
VVVADADGCATRGSVPVVLEHSAAFAVHQGMVVGVYLYLFLNIQLPLLIHLPSARGWWWCEFCNEDVVISHDT